MKLIIFILCSISWRCVFAESGNESSEAIPEKKLSEYILPILEHYKQQDPLGIPGVPVPDPLETPPFSKHFPVGTIYFKNVTLHGLSKFRIEKIATDLEKMQVTAALTMDELVVLGNYSLKTWISRSEGPFTVKLANVFVQAIASLEVERSGELEAQDIKMDITFKKIDMKFERLGFGAELVQSIMNSAGTFVFESVKPYVLKEVNSNIRNDVNKQVKNIPQKFSNSISPLDQLVIEARKKVRNMGYDPYQIADYNNTVGIIGIQLTNNWVYGLSSFHRVGNVNIIMVNNTLVVDVDIGLQKVKGTSDWEAFLAGGFLSKDGSISFSVDYFQVKVIIRQSLDTRNTPKLEDIQLEVGNIQIRSNGAGSADYLIEMGVNILPNLLRRMIIDALESPLRARIQEELNAINTEKLIHDNLDKIDEEQKNGFKSFMM